ncbi:unnamed protein product [Bemisia tabaci]|uniref:CUB domain-containing protein n=1 Tax=Bemisia tabaci TaxID=7038 RepID=A0A9P0ALE4_BEMTA|nr:unnamed protein product [Bemisia tabaci]
MGLDANCGRKCGFFGIRPKIRMIHILCKNRSSDRCLGIVDLWTSKSTGCACPYNKTGNDCACCTDGGCHCGLAAPNRCAQCGIQQYCTNMCNVTIDASTIAAQSNKTYGQIKSPSLEGPGTCWYLLRPDLGQRVEIQVHRILNIGRFNGTGPRNCLETRPQGTQPDSGLISPSVRLSPDMTCAFKKRYAEEGAYSMPKGIKN